MSRADYAHWNEEADRIWWEEEGKWEDDSEPEPDPDEDDYRTEWLRDDYEYDRAKENGEL